MPTTGNTFGITHVANPMYSSNRDTEQTRRLWKYTTSFLNQKYKNAICRLQLMVTSLNLEELRIMWILYPFQALNLFFTKRDYFSIAIENYAWYLLYFLVSAVIYGVCVWPTLMFTYSLIFGPGVAIVGTLHFFLHVNLWTMQWLRSRAVSTKRRLAVTISELESFPALLQTVSSNQFSSNSIHYEDLSHFGFWVNDIPWQVGKYVLVTSWGLFKCAIAFIPIVGVVLVVLIEAPTTGWLYFDSMRPGVGFYEDFAKYTAFGVSSALLDLIPALSGLTFTTNMIASAIMVKDEN
ncbi:HER197Cp [Eremothecium sinecaudum]|uniref:HER197Cp n=1 Tax=Eremothecium sinecaudum TaxID=45286 RepID=A0A0X8HTE2_9SACH|nr:HER197Cp [Eremothecium sinecaudum]AMD21476.1 HER197Cp [Eremothecium sinecaudum]